VALEKVTKQNYEAFFIAGSILNNQEADEVVELASSSVTAEDKDGTDKSTEILVQASKKLADDPNGSYSDNALAIQCKAGIEGESMYKVTFYMETNKGNKWEVDMNIKVKET